MCGIFGIEGSSEAAHFTYLGLYAMQHRGQESAGLPRAVHEACDARLVIPMAEGTRSLNIAIAAGIAAGEAVRQLRAASN